MFSDFHSYNINEIKNIINSIENKYLYDSNKLLEKIYIQSAEKEWDRKFDIIDYIYNKPDILDYQQGVFQLIVQEI